MSPSERTPSGQHAPSVQLAVQALGTPDWLCHPLDLEQVTQRALTGSARSAFLAGRCALRRLLASTLWAQATLFNGEEGEPRLSAAGVCTAPPYLSISHSGVLALAALADAPVMVDTEPVGRIEPSLWPLLFTDTEQQRLQAAGPHAGLLASLLFSIKECVCKGLRRAEVGDDFDLRGITVEFTHAAGWQIAVEGRPWPITLLAWRLLGDDAEAGSAALTALGCGSASTPLAQLAADDWLPAGQTQLLLLLSTSPR